MGEARLVYRKSAKQSSRSHAHALVSIASHKVTHGSVTRAAFGSRTGLCSLGGLVRSSGRRVIDLELPQGPSNPRAEATSDKDTAAAKEQGMQ